VNKRLRGTNRWWKGTNREDPLHQEIVEGLQGDLVGFAERLDQLLGRVRLGILKGLASEM
jgi:hypothetical protein